MAQDQCQVKPGQEMKNKENDMVWLWDELYSSMICHTWIDETRGKASLKKKNKK